MTLAELGWRGGPATGAVPGEIIGRVAVEHAGGYVILTEAGALFAEVSGRLRHETALGHTPGLPVVGDWVALQPWPGEDRATIRSVLPRRSQFARKSAGRGCEAQVIAANVDVVFLVSGLDGDLNPRRIERYLTLAWEGGARPVVVLNKADLCDDPQGAATRVAAVAPGVPIHVVSAMSQTGLDALGAYFEDHRTAALLGSSGVGKSSLINLLVGREAQQVQEVREDGRGRHTTTRRELLVRPGGGLVVDTPGLRELQLWEGGDGIDAAFAEVEDLARGCRFTDCSHRDEPGCAVRAAAADGALPPGRLESYHKLRREIRHLEARQDKRAQAELKRRDKALHRAANKELRRRGRD
jgi:ribosome biogenesis GTPase / thiamine phosphate phosphatase